MLVFRSWHLFALVWSALVFAMGCVTGVAIAHNSVSYHVNCDSRSTFVPPKAHVGRSMIRSAPSVGRQIAATPPASFSAAAALDVHLATLSELEQLSPEQTILEQASPEQTEQTFSEQAGSPEHTSPEQIPSEQASSGRLLSKQCPSQEHVLVTFTMFMGRGPMDEQSRLNLNFFMTVGASARCDLTIVLNVAIKGGSAEAFTQYVNASPLRERFGQPNVHVHFFEDCGTDLCGVYGLGLSKFFQKLTTKIRSQGVTLVYIFINSSVRGPFVNLAALDALNGAWFRPFIVPFSRDSNVVLVGNTWSCLLSLHSQSFAFAVNEKGFRLLMSHYGDGGIDSYKKSPSQYVLKYEVGFSKMVLSQGYQMRSVMESYYALNATEKFDCPRQDPLHKTNFFGMEMLPSDTIFYKTGGYVERQKLRSAAAKQRLKLHTQFQLEWALKQSPLTSALSEKGFQELFGMGPIRGVPQRT